MIVLPDAGAVKALVADARKEIYDEVLERDDLYGFVKKLADTLESLAPLLAPIGDETIKELITRLEAKINETYQSRAEPSNPLMQEAVLALRQQQAAMAWRTIDSAPKDETAVLVTNGGHPYVAFFRRGVWQYGRRNNFLPFIPTHWLPLPQPPEQVSPQGESATGAFRSKEGE